MGMLLLLHAVTNLQWIDRCNFRIRISKIIVYYSVRTDYRMLYYKYYVVALFHH